MEGRMVEEMVVEKGGVGGWLRPAKWEARGCFSLLGTGRWLEEERGKKK